MITVAQAGPRTFGGGDALATERDETLARAQDGDSAAFATLVRQHQAMVFSLALHALRSRPAAEDLAQEAFLHLYPSLAPLESGAHLVSWLRRVTTHRCIDDIRRRRVRPEHGMDTLPDRGSAPPARELFLEDRLEQMVADLPARARMVVVLRYQEELEPTEIAEALRMPINTVKSHLRRSLAALRARLVKQGTGQ